MSTHNTEGRREIEAIKQRLAAAKSQVSTATNNVASTKAMATKMIESAQSMSDAAQKEVKEIEETLKKAKDNAKDMKDALNNVKSMTQSNIDTMQSQLETSKKELKEVEKLLADAEERAKHHEDECSSNKRRKISPQTIVSSGITVKTEDGNDYDKETDNEDDQDDSNAGVTVKREEDNDHAYDDETDKEDGDKEDGKVEDDDGATKAPATNNHATSTNNTEKGALVSNSTGIGQSSTETTNDNNQVVIVEGCGAFDVNGTYTKVVGQMYNGAPVYKGTKFVIYRNSMSMGNYNERYGMGSNNWYIGNWDGNFSSISGWGPFYGSPNNANCMAPPTNGWVAYGSFSPAPKLRLVAANNDANSDCRQSNDDMNFTATSTTNNNDHVYDDETDKEDGEETTNQTINNVGNNSTANTASETSSSKEDINQVVVEGCGLSDVNGTYNKVPGVMYKGAPVYSKKVLHVVDQTVEHVIYRNSMSFSSNNWFISGWKGSVTDTDSSPNNVSFYGSPQNADCMAPPVNGWEVTYGQRPPPKVSSSSAPAADTQATTSSMSHQANHIVGQPTELRTVADLVKDAEELLVAARGATRSAIILGDADQISVEGCGNVEINGIYIRSAHNGTTPVYIKRGVWKDKSVTFTLFWDRVKTWYIGLECLTTKHWERFTLFKSPVIAALQGQDFSMIPPENGWKIVGRVRGGVLPAPTCRPMINNKIISTDHRPGLSNVDQIVVRGCGEPEVNGAYDRAVNLVYRGNSVYIKPGQWDVSTSTGSPNCILYRDVLSSIKSDWYIGRLYSEVTSDNIGTSSTLYTSQHNSVTPPETGWDACGASYLSKG